MKKSFFAVALFTVFFAVSAYAVNTTRYWDGCKPSCGWAGNASGSPNGVCKSCNVSGSVLSDDGARNACEGGGTAYTCMKQAPWKVSDNLSYGFAASHTNGDCGKCFELTFTNTSISGKKMVIMVSNIGGDVGQNQFDLMIPGGGVGQFNALSNQIQQNGGNNSDLGIQYGGFRGKCGNDKSCVRRMCEAAFGSSALADMKAGCDWYVDWFDNADNPQANSSSVTCPQALIDKYKGNFSNNSNPPPPPPPSNNTYTLTVNRNPTNGGTTNITNQSNINAGSQVQLSATAASGYTFVNWTVSGSGTFANANSASTSVTVNGNITVTANFSSGNPGSGNPGSGNPTPVRGDTIKVEAENYASKVGDGMKTEAGAIGWIENGYSATYNVNIGKAGSATMQFMIATEVQSNFTVKVNGTNVGTISQGSTGSWSTFKIVQLSNAVNLRQGSNTIVLEFGSAVNVDYFLLIGDIRGSTSVRRAAAKEASGHSIALKPARNGFSALLPANHGYTSYKLIDVLGREIRSGKIGADANGLNINGLKQNVFFLRLEGKGKTPTALKVVTN
jgi:uncharacterized repeat protein (TIGR02543 family)